MYESLIKNYISKLTLEDIKRYASIKDINANEEEMQIVYEFIKNHYDKLLSQDMPFIENKLKNKLRPSLYNTLLNLYNEEKKKYL